MKKSLLYYYEDLGYEMDMSIFCLQHELVTMLDSDDCIDCHELRLQNAKKTASKSRTTSRTSTDSGVTSDTDKMNDAFYNAAPPAGSLPKPRWIANKTSNERKKPATEKISLDSLSIWVRASIPHITQSTSSVSFPVPRKVLDEINYSWPPFPESIWSDETLKETTAREQILRGEQEGDVNSSVVEFFSHFGKKQAIPKTAFA